MILYNEVMTTPKCQILSFGFTVLCFKKSLFNRMVSFENIILQVCSVVEHDSMHPTKRSRSTSLAICND